MITILKNFWLEFEITDPNGNTDSYEREIVDRLGYDVRVNGGDGNFALDSDNSQLVSEFDIYTTGFWPNIVPCGAQIKLYLYYFPTLGDTLPPSFTTFASASASAPSR